MKFTCILLRDPIPKKNNTFQSNKFKVVFWW
jgi:hypothetical protein